MRLDLWLVKEGYFKTRNRAKIAIKQGLVRVNGVVVKKPSAEVNESYMIEVLDDKPAGYWKLKHLDETFGIFKGDEVVLDLGSSAGGFLLYASERAKFVYGIEFSKEFEEALKELESLGNVKIFIEDAFKFDINKIEPVDVILNDLTLPFTSSMTALRRFLPKLKPDGKILFVHKLNKGNEADFKGFEIIAFERAKDKREVYYLIKPIELCKC
ncbi:MAG: S4 domain-containing protein [Archaeoglobales archaeon]|nr:S4 domain-containing protein [Archaeoglobales archaeon]